MHLCVVSALVVVPVLVSISPGGLGRRVHDVDIRTGRVGSYSEFMFWRTPRTVRDSVISKTLPAVAGTAPNWHIVQTFEGARHVHTAYHGAISDLRSLDTLWQMVPFTPAAKRQVAAEVLRLWQSQGDDYEAGRYIQDVSQAGFRVADRSGAAVTVADLPPRRGGAVPATRAAR